MSDEAALRAELVAWKAACARRDRQWAALFSEGIILEGRGERPRPWDEFVASLEPASEDAAAAPAPPAAPRWKFANAYDAQVRSFDEDSDLEIVSLAESPEAGLALVEQAAAPVEAAAPKSRKRGRPRKVPSAAPPPKTAEAAAPERKRGRPRKVVAAPSPLGSEPEQRDAAATPRGRQTGRPRDGSATSYSKYTGVTHQYRLFVAKIYADGKDEFLGSFSSEVEAAKAYDARARELGRLSRLNFPREDTDSDLDIVSLEEPEGEPKRRATPGTSETASKFTGVHRNHLNRWVAQINISGKQEYLGCFKSEVEAAKAYDARAREIGRIGKLNFPTDDDPPSYVGVQRTRFKGKSWNENYFARISENGTQRHLGTFSTAVEAAKAYDARARQLGRFYNLNFPTAEEVRSGKARPARRAAEAAAAP